MCGVVPRMCALVAFVCACMGLGCARGASPVAEFPTVTTFAGSGDAGVDDGPARSAQFVFPTGVAVDRHGNVFVADAGAQRIRMIAPDGTVSTIAGGGDLHADRMWVDGSFADGPAASARFFVPFAIAVDGNDTLYVADSEHHCIRTVRAGNVATFAGDCNTAGDRLGARTHSLFSRPVGIAIDREGDIYVADLVDGVREISRDGRVLALDVPVHNPGAIAIYEDGSGITYAVADPQGVVLVRPHAKPVRLGTIGPFGYANGLALLSPWTLVYTDARTNTVRYFDKQDGRVLAGAAYDDVENEGGGYKDGIGAEAEFNAPLGVAAMADGSFIVADSNNRRLRKISAFDMRSASDPLFSETPTLDPNDYNVLLVGGSFAWYDTDYQSSIAGQIENDLKDVRPGGKRIVVSTVASRGISLSAVADLFPAELADLHPDFVILLMNSGYFGATFPQKLLDGRHNADVVRQSIALVAGIKKSLDEKDDVLAVVHPWPWELAGTESTYHRFYEKIDQEWLVPVPSFHQMLVDINEGAGVPVLDMWPILKSHEAGADRKPYFGAENPHFTIAGRQLVGESIADYLKARHPWAATP